MPPTTRYGHGSWDELDGEINPFIKVDCLLPTGVIIPLETERDATIADIKEDLWKEAQNYPLFSMLKDKNSYVFMCISEHAAKVELDEENRRLSDVRPFRPMLKAVEKQGNRAEKIMNEEIARLIDKSLHEFDQLKSPEVSDFRKRMQTMCEKIARERDSQPWTERLMSQYPPDVAPEIPLPPHIQEKLIEDKISITVRLAYTNVSYTFRIPSNSHPEQLVQFAVEKRAKNTGEPVASLKDFVLKVCGREEYFLGSYPLSQFKYVRKAIAKGITPQLLLVRRDTIFDEPPVLPPRANGMYSHSGRRGSHPAPPPPSTRVRSRAEEFTWDIEEDFMLTVNGVSNVKGYADYTKLQLRLCVYHGPVTMCSIFNTQGIMLQEGYANFKEVVTFDMNLCDIPRMARLCFMLDVIPEKRGKSRPPTTGTTPRKVKQGRQHMVPLAWVNIPVFDYRDVMRSGTHKLYMWPVTDDDGLSEELLNPIGTVENNPLVEDAVCLSITFHKYNRDQICYPPFEKVLEVAAKHTDLGSTPPCELDRREGTIRKAINSAMFKVTPVMREELRKHIDRDPLDRLHEQDKELIWNMRFECRYHFPYSLPKLLSCVKWNSYQDVAQMQALLQIWQPLPPTDALELLDFAYADKSVRKFAVNCLKELSDCELYQYMLQLVQVLKYESYLECDLVEFLLRKALFNQRIGHCLFWLLRSEMQVPSVSVRFGLILEAYCRGNKQHLAGLKKQVQALGKFQDVSDLVKKQKVNERGKEEMKNKLTQNTDMFSGLLSMLDPCQKMKQLRIEQCSFKDSKMRPLWLVWENTDSLGNDIYIMYKSGDDLRQDMLTLQILKIMDNIWQSDGLDLRLNTYGCLSTGHREGLIEIVTESKTIAKIQEEMAPGSAIRSAFNKECLYQWLLQRNQTEYGMAAAMEEFTMSCVGYCVATYVLGVGDRHSDNIMLKKNGQLFHIDFGHILGRFKSKFGVRRERVPFVLTSDFVYVIRRGPKNSSEDFIRFRECCERAYLSLRQRCNFLITLFMMMMNTGIPEISSVENIEYLRETLVPHLGEDDALHHFRSKFQEALKNSIWAKINFALHNARRNQNM